MDLLDKITSGKKEKSSNEFIEKQLLRKVLNARFAEYDISSDNLLLVEKHIWREFMNQYGVFRRNYQQMANYSTYCIAYLNRITQHYMYEKSLIDKSQALKNIS